MDKGLKHLLGMLSNFTAPQLHQRSDCQSRLHNKYGDETAVHPMITHPTKHISQAIHHYHNVSQHVKRQTNLQYNDLQQTFSPEPGSHPVACEAPPFNSARR